MKHYKFFILTLGILIFDQVVKLLVHYNMDMGVYGEIKVIGDWFRLHYMLNEGMAFGMKLDWEYGKVLLTSFRLIASIVGIYLIIKYSRKEVHPGLLWSGALILAGALGNVIDSIFYGVWLDNAPYDAPTPWFHGQVIDMLYFPIFSFTWPDWVPFLAGDDFHFFSAIFNVADASIFVGVCIILIFQKRFLPEEKSDNMEPDSSEEQKEESLQVS